MFDVSNELKPLSNFYSVRFSNWCFLSSNQGSGLKRQFENPSQNQFFLLVVFLLWWFVSRAPLVSLFIILFRKCASCTLGGYSRLHSWEILNGSDLKLQWKVEKFFGLKKLLFLYQPLRLVFKMMLRIRPLIGCRPMKSLQSFACWKAAYSQAQSRSFQTSNWLQWLN